MFAQPRPLKTSTATAVRGESHPAGRWLHLPRSRWRRGLFLGVYFLFCWGLVYSGSKLFWKLRAGVPLDETADIWDFFYPELRLSGVHATHPRHNDDRFDVLLLGGSVLESDWGSVAERLEEKLRADVGERFRVYNLSHSAHTSRDSLLKYSQLADGQFELVIVYDGINDVRLNCCPRELFRDDYRHFAWYNSFQKHLDAGSILLPASLVDETLMLNETFRFNPENEALLEEARDIKTTQPLRQNLDEIARAAANRGDKVLFTTFAYFIPENYTQERFDHQSLTYSYRNDGRSCAAELWGKPRYVAAAIDAQNAAIRGLAAERPEVLFVDERELMPEAGHLFADPCHLTDEGSRKFVENLWPAVQRRVGDWRAARRSAK